MRNAVILSAVRTPTGKFLGALKDLTAADLGARVVREAVARAGIDPAIVDECIMGNVIQAGNGQNPARQAALNGGLADHVAALTINKVCGSGLKAVMLAAQGIAVGDIDIAVAGGMESMSNAPYLLPRVREGLRMGDGTVVDSLIHDGLWCAFEDCHMGISGEVVADKYNVRRDEQDRYAAESHRKAAQATSEGWFKDEILPIEIPQRKGNPIVVDKDEGIRADTTPEGLARLQPAFRKDGSVTAGNASGVNDAAAAVVVMADERAKALGLTPMARIVGQATSGLPPKLVMMTPVEAVRKVAAKVGWKLEDVDLFELNEAFSVQSVALIKELGIDAARVNVHGGAVALGHAIGASGARVLTTLLYALKRRNLETRHRFAVSWRRQRRGARDRATLAGASVAIQRIGVIGAGTMGNGIAQVFAQAGFEVRLVDAAAGALDRAKASVEKSLGKLVEKSRLTATERDATLSRLATATNADTLGDSDYIVEAIFEDRQAKQSLFARLDQLTRPDVILSSNTSSISITTLGAATNRPDRVLGMHFMNPVPLMSLVELIRGQATSADSMLVAAELCMRLNKTAVEASDYPGFIANRILMPMINEAIFAVMEGVGTAESIDTVMKLGMNHPMGPLTLADFIGLDVCLAILEVLHEGLGDPKYRACPLLRRMVAAGQLGRKSGQGFYKY